MCPDHPGSPIGHCGYFLGKPHDWTPEQDTLPTPEETITEVREHYIQETIRFSARYKMPLDLDTLRQTALTLFPDEPKV